MKKFQKLNGLILMVCASLAYADGPAADVVEAQPVVVERSSPVVQPSMMQAFAQADRPVPQSGIVEGHAQASQQASVVDIDRGGTTAAIPQQSGSVMASSSEPQDLTPEQRIAKLERQVQRMQQLQSQSHLREVQERMDDFQGRLDVLAHTIRGVKQGLRDLYQLIDKQSAKTLAATPVQQSIAAARGVGRVPPTLGQAESSLKEQDIYENAYGYIKHRQYSQAIKAMRDYIVAYPQGLYVVNANYWLGELNLLNGHSQQAKQYFTTVVTQFPKQPKVADALLKLGYIAYDSTNYPQAQHQFKQVIKRYPETAAARLAAKRLRSMAAAGQT